MLLEVRARLKSATILPVHVIYLQEAVVEVPLVEDGAEEVDFSDYNVYTVPTYATLFVTRPST